MTQLHKTCNLGAPRLKRFLATSSVSQEEHVNPESKSLFFCFFLNTSVFIPLEHVYSNQTWAESSIIKVPVKSCTLSPTSPACRPYKHPPTHKYLILPNPDRKCPRQWSRMLLTDPRLLFLPRSALSLSSPPPLLNDICALPQAAIWKQLARERSHRAKKNTSIYRVHRFGEG